MRALDGVDLEIEKGRFTAIIGTSGSGKSTLLNMLGGLDTPTEGSIRIGNTELAGLNSEQAAVFRRKQIGFIFQNYNLIPVLTVWENIVFPISLDGQKIVMITHNPEIAQMADRVVRIEDGRIVA